MRLWSIHPRYLDGKGLLALWREGLLAQNVLLGKTSGYKNHPQLERFKNTGDSVGAIACYLRAVVEEAERRGYSFDKGKIANRCYKSRIKVPGGQVKYEFQHLLSKLQARDKERFINLKDTRRIMLHPMFVKTSGEIAGWEKAAGK